ncbi:helix-turn-helix domain-containing protein [Pseudonocardia lacus]|uniref:helix-turn-helix domain-containing protein n=1 Tax=Pseudonocardia lacus TaxID=2835865 RepID=UPI0027E325FB|nr:helix-turn-helix transcriptional regulator [Pseudonocardia lacus]
MTDTAATGSTVPRRQLGRHLRDARGRARLTVRAAAEALEWSEPKIWRIETGQTSMRSHDVEAMCRIYGVAEELTEALKALAKETKGRGWWHSYGDVIPNWLDLYIGLEAAASDMRFYESELVPGLFQTADYIRTIFATYKPDLDSNEIERRVGLRVARQAVLTRVTARPTLTVAINEAILHRAVGGPRVMRNQLMRLVELSELPNVELRVVPFAIGIHEGVTSGPFTILRFPKARGGREVEPPIVYIEGVTGALYLDKQQEVERFEAVFRHILQEVGDEDGSVSRGLLLAGIRRLER